MLVSGSMLHTAPSQRQCSSPNVRGTKGQQALIPASLQLWLHYLILTLASMILVLATSKGVVTAAAKPPV